MGTCLALHEAPRGFWQAEGEAISAAQGGRWAPRALGAGGDVQSTSNPTGLDWRQCPSSSVAVQRGQRFPGLVALWVATVAVAGTSCSCRIAASSTGKQLVAVAAA